MINNVNTRRMGSLSIAILFVAVNVSTYTAVAAAASHYLVFSLGMFAFAVLAGYLTVRQVGHVLFLAADDFFEEDEGPDDADFPQVDSGTAGLT